MSSSSGSERATRLSREERKELRDLGWRYRRHKSKRPRRIPTRDLVPVDEGEDLLVNVEAET